MTVDIILSIARVLDIKIKGSSVDKVRRVAGGYWPRVINFHLTRIKALLIAIKRL